MSKKYKIIIEDENTDCEYENIVIMRDDIQDNICELGLSVKSVEEIKEFLPTKLVAVVVYKTDLTGRCFCNSCEFECANEVDMVNHIVDQHKKEQ